MLGLDGSSEEVGGVTNREIDWFRLVRRRARSACRVRKRLKRHLIPFPFFVCASSSSLCPPLLRDQLRPCGTRWN